MLKKIILGLLLVVPIPALAQTGAIEGFCDQGGRHATTSGLNASNFQQGDIPSCTITVYVANTQSLATLYSDRSGTPLSNPFTADVSGSVFPGHWIFWASTSQAYDVIGSGGISPNTYPAPVPLCTDCYPSSQFNVTGGVQTIEGVNSYNCTGPTCDISGEALALEHNSSATGILQTLLNLCDNGSCGPALDAGYQQVFAKTGTGDGSWKLETAVPGNMQPFITYPAVGNAQILYPLAEGVVSSCSSGLTCSPVANANYPASIVRTSSGAGSGSEIDWTGVQPLPSSIPASSVTAVYGCWLGYATTGQSGNNGERTVLANAITVTANTPSALGYGTYCAEIASGGAAQTFDYAAAVIKMNDGSSTFYTATSYFFMQPFLIAYSVDAPAQGTANGMVADQPLQISGNHLQLPAGWRAVFDTGAGGAAYGGTSSSFTSPILAGTEIDLIPSHTNTSTAPTFDLNSGGAVTIVKGSGSTLALGDIVPGYPATLKMDSAGTLVLENPVTGAAGGGTVTSVGMTVPGWLTVSGSPITSSGTLAVTANTGQTQNEALMTPNGSTGAVGLRALVNADFPSSGVSAGSYTNSNLTVNAQGIITSASNGSAGSGLPSCTSGQMVYYASSGTTGTCLTVGTNLSITSSTLNASGGGSLTVGSTTISGGTSGNGLYDNAGVLGEKAFAPALGNCTAETANFSVAAASCYIGNASSGITATLPSISTGAIMRIQNNNTGTVTASFGSNFNCTLNGTTTSTTTCAIANGSTGIVTTDGTSWYVAVTPTSASSGGGGGLCPAVNNQTGTSYTLVLTDGTTGGNACIGTLTVSNVASNTVTVPPNASVALPVPDEIDVIQLGSGQTCLVAGAGVTLNTATSVCARAANSTFAIRQIATNTWQVSGDTQ